MYHIADADPMHSKSAAISSNNQEDARTRRLSSDDGDIGAWMTRVREEARRLFDRSPRLPSADAAANISDAMHRSLFAADSPMSAPQLSSQTPQDSISPSPALSAPPQFNSHPAYSFQSFPYQPIIPSSSPSGVDAHSQLLALEAEFQTRLMRFQDDQTSDYNHISNLKYPLDTLLDLFISLGVSRPNPTSQTAFSQSSPSAINIEQTLGLIQTLLSQYEGALTALQRARDTVGRVESSYVLQQQRVTEWGAVVVRDLHRARQSIQRTQERMAHIETERDVLRRKTVALDRDRRTGESLVLDMARKLRVSEEKCVRLERDLDKSASQIMHLKSQLAGIKRIRSHFVDALTPANGASSTRGSARGAKSPASAVLPAQRLPYDPFGLRNKSTSPSRDRARAALVRAKHSAFMEEIDVEREMQRRTHSRRSSASRMHDPAQPQKRAVSQYPTRSRQATPHSRTHSASSVVSSGLGERGRSKTPARPHSRSRSKTRATPTDKDTHSNSSSNSMSGSGDNSMSDVAAASTAVDSCNNLIHSKRHTHAPEHRSDTPDWANDTQTKPKYKPTTARTFGRHNYNAAPSPPKPMPSSFIEPLSSVSSTSLVSSSYSTRPHAGTTTPDMSTSNNQIHPDNQQHYTQNYTRDEQAHRPRATSSHNASGSGHHPTPAKVALLSRLRQVDHEINRLAQDLLLY